MPKGDLVLLHGRGSGPEDLAELADPMRSKGFRIVSLQAPILSPGGGWMWYRFGTRGPVVKDVERSLNLLDELTAPSDSSETRQHRMLVGFSQGASMSLAFAFSRPERLDGVVAFSGFLMDEPALPVPAEELKNLPVLLVHGLRDRAIPISLARKSKERLEDAGVRVRLIEHEGSHEIPSMAWKEATDWIISI